jgi:hypothetical protein
MESRCFNINEGLAKSSRGLLKVSTNLLDKDKGMPRVSSISHPLAQPGHQPTVSSGTFAFKCAFLVI